MIAFYYQKKYDLRIKEDNKENITWFLPSDTSSKRFTKHSMFKILHTFATKFFTMMVIVCLTIIEMMFFFTMKTICACRRFIFISMTWLTILRNKSIEKIILFQLYKIRIIFYFIWNPDIFGGGNLKEEAAY